MGKFKYKQTSKFSLEGRFAAFEGGKPHQPKALTLLTSEGEYSLKLAKYLRLPLLKGLMPGDWIQVEGLQAEDLETGLFKFKAYQVRLLSPHPSDPEVTNSLPACPKSTATKVLICQSSSCVKRGSKQVQKALEAALCDRGLADQVMIKKTGCMDACKKGPHVVVMPGKARYQRLHPQDIPALVSEHWPTATQNSQVESMID
ncbi:(2Fe-2S) ferredoxin domain-containing protein [Synechococcales cyanobacterium C]|uniref:(2Fe-2S) ferredoxin domain-containing protein n=1 Tax=Petrachloros mirabilis ULC683 TaxID=2781853 RepID=A0A8K1ZX31_9CYAN|nr:(2Fe-2S) ferredoxin domain-containing protein [Petrachloros mirabilis]NCJ06764.1 (2Fe-2S) ferredoxin domain-containing protein [Petrachloros mirabilis ULC683]